MDVDEDVPVDCAPDSGPLDLVRLEDGIAVREDDRRPERAQVRQYLQRLGVEAIRERVAQEIAGRGEQARIPILPLPPLLHSAEVVAVAELDEPPLLNTPVPLRDLTAERRHEVRLHVLADPVVVEQCVVDIDEERQRGGVGHGDILAHHSPTTLALGTQEVSAARL